MFKTSYKRTKNNTIPLFCRHDIIKDIIHQKNEGMVVDNAITMCVWVSEGTKTI